MFIIIVKKIIKKMDTKKFEKDYKWVIKSLESCVTIDQLTTMNKLFDLFIKKWSNHLVKTQITLIMGVFHKFYKIQKRKIKKSFTTTN
jgi:hypothetical protein